MVRLSTVVVILSLASAATTPVSAQSVMVAPTISSINPNYGGANTSGPWTITGTNFSIVPKATRFVDADLADIFYGVSCSSTTMCQGYLRPGLVAPGAFATLSVRAMVGAESSSGTNFLYYGVPVITSVVPNSGPINMAIPYTLNATTLTSAANGFPGTTSVYLMSSVADLASGCGSILSCARTAPRLDTDVDRPQGAWSLVLGTPGGGGVTTYFLYGSTPATPTMTSISPASGSVAGGNTVTITGTNFIPGTNSPGSGGTILRTSFNFHGNGSSSLATAVNCSSSTTCTAVVPGGSPGPVNVEVYTVCPVNAPQCSSNNARPSVSVPNTTVGAYTRSGIKVTGLQSGLATSENGQATQFAVSLYTQPASNVTLTLSVSTSPAPATLSTSQLIFTNGNWNVPQTVTVTGVNDDGVGGHPPPTVGNTSVPINIVASGVGTPYDGVSTAGPPIAHIDNDSKNYYISPQTGLVTTRDGGTATFTVLLSQAPAAPVTLDLTSGDPREGSVSPSVLTFATTAGGATGWNVPRTVTVTGLASASAPRDLAYAILLRFTSADTSYGNGNLLTQPDVAIVNTGTGPPLPQDFDALTVPALPAGWQTATTGAIGPWTSVNSGPVDTAANAAVAPSIALSATTSLTSPPIAVPPGTWRLKFRNLYNLENTNDGMVLEISIAGGAFTDIAAAGSFTAGGYTGTLSASNPLTGRLAWTGLSGGTTASPTYLTTLVTLPAAASGQTIQLRWRVAYNSSLQASGLAGARIDTISLMTVPAVTTGAANPVGATTATLSGTANPNGTATNGRYEYGLTTSYGTTTPLQALGAGFAYVPIGGGAISSLTCGTLYHFRARAEQVESGITTGTDNVFVTTGGAACAFTDPTLSATTAIKRVHITELRTRIDTQRARFGLSAFSWTTPTLTVGVSVVQAAHVSEMRTALNAVYVAAAMAAPVYTDPVLTLGTSVKAVHIMQLRNALFAIE